MPVELPTDKVSEIVLLGEVKAPRHLLPTLQALTTANYGEYNPAEARSFMAEHRLGREFFELLAEPIVMNIMGKCVLESGVTVELLREKVSEIKLYGQLTAPQELVPLLQVLAVEHYGQLIAEGDE